MNNEEKILQALEEMRGSIASMQGDITGIKKRQEGDGAALSHLGTSTILMEKSIHSVQEGVSSVKHTVATLEGDITSIKHTLATVQGDVAALHGDVTSIQGDVAAMQGDITAIQGDVTAMQGDITAMQGDITAMQGDITAIQGDVAAIQGDVAAMQGNLSIIEERQEAHTESIITLEGSTMHQFKLLAENLPNAIVRSEKLQEVCDTVESHDVRLFVLEQTVLAK